MKTKTVDEASTKQRLLDAAFRKIERDAAQSEARLEMAMDNVASEHYDIEQDAKQLQANETLRQFEMELLRHIGQGVLQLGNAFEVIRVALYKRFTGNRRSSCP